MGVENQSLVDTLVLWGERSKMLFNSYIFILIFLPVTLVIYYVLGRIGKYDIAKYFLILASLVFYAYNNVYYLLIICSSLLANYLISKVMAHLSERPTARRVWLAIALLVNLGILFYFKYFDFLLENINTLFSQQFDYLGIALPLGISVYTFQQISYVVDVYSGKAGRYAFVDYALFVTFFPQLIAGSIALHSEMVPQFQDKTNYLFNADSFAEGIYDFSIGLAKKVLIADKLGSAVDAGYLAMGG